MTRRVGWGFVDQALSSISNFGVNILVARSVDARGFGIYALMFTVYLLVLGLSRSLATDTFMVRYAGYRGDRLRSRQSAAAGAALLIGVIAAVLLAGASFGFSGTIRASLLAFAVVLPGLMLQDAWRVLFFADGRPQQAALNDLVWGLAQVVLIVGVLVAGAGTVPNLVLAWGGGGAVAALAGSLQGRFLPSLRQAWPWVRENRDLGVPYLGEFVAARGGSQVNVYGLALVASISTVGVLKAGQILMGPLNVLQMGVAVSATPEAVRLRDRSVPALRRVLLGVGAGVAAVALAWGIALTLLPDRAGRVLLGENWMLASAVILPLAIQRASQGMADGAVLGLRVLGAAKQTFRLRTVVVSLGVVGTLVGGWRYGAVGAAVGAAMAGWVGVALWWRKFVQVAKAYRPGDVHAEVEPLRVEDEQ